MQNRTNANIDHIIRTSIRECLAINSGFKPTDTLVICLYSVLKSVFIDNKKHIILSAPTGTGKSVIGYMLHFTFMFVKGTLETLDIKKWPDDWKNEIPSKDNFDLYDYQDQSFTLTSSKILQEQIEGDFERFSLNDAFVMLKGISNYECTKMTQETGTYHNYSERWCMGMKMFEKEQLPCYETCGYLQKRQAAASSSGTVLNYAYFLNVLKSPNNPFFGPRALTIADEAHLIPEIVLSNYNIELNMYTVLQLQKLIQQVGINFNKHVSEELFDIQTNLGECFRFFTQPLNNNANSLDILEAYFTSLTTLIKDVLKIYDKLKVMQHVGPVATEMFEKTMKKLRNSLEMMDYEDTIKGLRERPEDLMVLSEFINKYPVSQDIGNLKVGQYPVHRHNVYDLSEAAMCRRYFLNKVDVCIYLSATLGNIDQFAELMGLTKEEYAGFRLESDFDFSKSPIFMTNSGYLNYNNFNSNIDKCVMDTFYICENLHPQEKGIIHTSTFNIANMLRDKVMTGKAGVTNPKRYLFYSNSDEKEACINLLKSDSTVPYVIIGPSLYEGIDLKDSQGRFNIIVKAPYSGMSEYTKEKMKRYPFWYEREVLQKLEQAIGRTNRHKEDYSSTYLIDTVLNKLAFKLPPHLTARLKMKKL